MWSVQEQDCNQALRQGLITQLPCLSEITSCLANYRLDGDPCLSGRHGGGTWTTWSPHASVSAETSGWAPWWSRERRAAGEPVKAQSFPSTVCGWIWSCVLLINLRKLCKEGWIWVFEVWSCHVPGNFTQEVQAVFCCFKPCRLWWSPHCSSSSPSPHPSPCPHTRLWAPVSPVECLTENAQIWNK